MRFCEELSEASVLVTQIRNSQQVTVLRCYGRLVHGDGADALRQAVISQDEHHFAIDLSGVEAIDAAGLGVLAELENWAAARGGAIQLLNPTARLLEVLKATGLNSVLEICPNPPAAGEAP
jgi:anti-anti-sigma factor